MNKEEVIKQAEQQWQMEKLCKDLNDAKIVCRNPENPPLVKITSNEYFLLCGILCYYKPGALAKIIHREPTGLRVELTRGLYRYIEKLLQTVEQSFQFKQTTDIPNELEKLGYKKGSPVPPPPRETKVGWRLWIDIDNIDSIQMDAIVKQLQQIPGNAFLRLEKIEQGSIVLFFEGSQEGFEQIEALFRAEQLTELLGVPVLDVRLTSAISTESYSLETPTLREEIRPTANVNVPVNLSQWLQNNLAEAVEAGWQTLEEIFGTRTTIPAFRSSESATVRRAKLIDFATLPDGQAVALIAALTPAQNQEISVRLQVYPVGNVTYLPENLALSVIYKTQTEKVQAGSEHNCLEMEFTGLPGEQFSVQLALGDISVTENFHI